MGEGTRHPATEHPCLGVSEVRRGLHTLRVAWQVNSPTWPICPSEEAVPGISMSEFAYRFVLDHHTRRPRAAQRANGADESRPPRERAVDALAFNP
jgi:hypothetical protein